MDIYRYGKPQSGKEAHELWNRAGIERVGVVRLHNSDMPEPPGEEAES
jgi:hypothetical protein